MFGFVTFVYPETVKLILAKGNPHFICDARVLVKPYKEKGKVPDKYRQAELTYSPHCLSRLIPYNQFVTCCYFAGSSTSRARGWTSPAALLQLDSMPETPSTCTSSVSFCDHLLHGDWVNDCC